MFENAGFKMESGNLSQGERALASAQCSTGEGFQRNWSNYTSGSTSTSTLHVVFFRVSLPV